MKKSKWFHFLGGWDLVLALGLIIALALVLQLGSNVNHLFSPLFIILSNMLLLLLISFLLYFLFNPIINFLERHHFKRLWAVVFLYVVVVLFIAGAGVYIFPKLQEQFASFFTQFPSLLHSLVENGVSLVEDIEIFQIENGLYDQLQEKMVELINNIGVYYSSGINQISSLISSITSIVVTILTAPIILFFLLKDDEKMFFGTLKIIPPAWRQDFVYLAKQIQTQVGAYIKGQLEVAVINVVLLYAGFKLIGLNYSGVLALLGGILSLIPYIGATLTFIPAVVIALMNSFAQLVLLLAIWAVIQFLEGNLIEPNIMGKTLDIHPLTIIITLLIMGDLFGLFGLIFGVPIYAIIKILVDYLFNKFKIRYNKYFGHVSGNYQTNNSTNRNFSDEYVEEWQKDRQRKLKKEINK